MASEIVFALYMPHAGKEKKLEELIARHVPVLRELELITSRPRLTLKAQDGTYIEVIEWVNSDAAEKAHEHPAVAQVWEAMEAFGDRLGSVAWQAKILAHERPSMEQPK